jgi:hypothetical protein
MPSIGDFVIEVAWNRFEGVRLVVLRARSIVVRTELRMMQSRTRFVAVGNFAEGPVINLTTSEPDKRE